MITRAQILAKNRLRLVSIVTKDGHIIKKQTLDMLEPDRTGISGWPRRDIGNEFGRIHGASLFVGEDGIVGEILLPGSPIAGDDRVVQLLSSPDQFLLRNG